ncbi:MAG: TRAP transporter substrate-binding protein [Deferrisomatales bacterium]
MRIRPRLAHLALAALAATLAGGPPAAAKDAPVTLTYAFFAPAGTFPGKQMAHWAEEVTKRTDGLVTVQTFPGGTLLGAQDMYDGVLRGVADIGLGSPSYDPGRFPLTAGASLPVGFPNATVGSLVLWELVKEFKPEEYAKYKVIALFTTEPGYIQSKAPVRTLADLKGMKLRAAGTGVPVLKALGAAPVGMPMPEVPQAIQTGVIDGTMTSRDVLKDFKLAEMVRYVTDYRSVVVTFAAVMVQMMWESLPPKAQKVIDELGREMAVWTGRYHDQQNVGGAMAWGQKEHGLQLLPLAAEERAKWDALLQPMVDEWARDAEAKGLPAKKFLSRLRELRDQIAKDYP